MKNYKETAAVIAACRTACVQRDEPFHADALAAALGVSYEKLIALAEGNGVARRTAALLRGALQECTASVVAAALSSDPKTHNLWMFYLRNRAGFADKGERGELKFEAGTVTFVGEERI